MSSIVVGDVLEGEGIRSGADVVSSAGVRIVVVVRVLVVVSDALPPVHPDKATVITRAATQRSTALRCPGLDMMSIENPDV
ncbi:MAG: hypothetical protein V3V29_00795 [Acidimicrobiia bacterium]